MKHILLTLTLSFLFILSITGQNLSSDLQDQITALGDGDSFELKYVKKGCWGTYEGGGITYTLLNDSIEVILNNKQVYLGSNSITTSQIYQVNELLQTLEENKKSFIINEENIVIANSFEYRLEANGKELAAGRSALEPSDVIYKVALSNSLMDSFLGKKKGLLHNSGVIKGPRITN